MTDEFREAWDRYYELFGEPPPVNADGMWPYPDDALAMVRRAIKRGTPITDDDFPELPPGIVV